MWWKKSKEIKLDPVQQYKYDAFKESIKYIKRNLEKFDITAGKEFPFNTSYNRSYFGLRFVTKWIGSSYNIQAVKYIEIEKYDKQHKIVIENHLDKKSCVKITIENFPDRLIREMLAEFKALVEIKNTLKDKHDKYWHEQFLIKHHEQEVKDCIDLINKVSDPVHDIILGDEDK